MDRCSNVSTHRPRRQSQRRHCPHDYCWHSWKNATQMPAVIMCVLRVVQEALVERESQVGALAVRAGWARHAWAAASHVAARREVEAAVRAARRQPVARAAATQHAYEPQLEVLLVEAQSPSHTTHPKEKRRSKLRETHQKLVGRSDLLVVVDDRCARQEFLRDVEDQLRLTTDAVDNRLMLL